MIYNTGGEGDNSSGAGGTPKIDFCDFFEKSIFRIFKKI